MTLPGAAATDVQTPAERHVAPQSPPVLASGPDTSGAGAVAALVKAEADADATLHGVAHQADVCWETPRPIVSVGREPAESNNLGPQGAADLTFGEPAREVSAGKEVAASAGAAAASPVVRPPRELVDSPSGVQTAADAVPCSPAVKPEAAPSGAVVGADSAVVQETCVAPAGVPVGPVPTAGIRLPCPGALGSLSVPPGGDRSPLASSPPPQKPVRLCEKRKSDISPPEGSDIAAYSPLLTPFIYKLYCLVSDEANDSLVHWTPAGDAFLVPDPLAFAATVLPSFFKHNQIQSFVRQLNKYRFSKIAPGTFLFSHQKFLKGRPDLLPEIVRQSAPDRPSGLDTKVAVAPIPIAPLVDTSAAVVAASARGGATTPNRNGKRPREESEPEEVGSAVPPAKRAVDGDGAEVLQASAAVPLQPQPRGIVIDTLVSVQRQLEEMGREMKQDRAAIEARLVAVESSCSRIATAVEALANKSL